MSLQTSWDPDKTNIWLILFCCNLISGRYTAADIIAANITDLVNPQREKKLNYSEMENKSVDLLSVCRVVSF